MSTDQVSAQVEAPVDPGLAPPADAESRPDDSTAPGSRTGLGTDAPAGQLRLVIVTGMSGAGRSTAANALEDLGWYVVDNLPPSVLPEVCDQARQVGLTRLAVVLDVRTRSFFEQLAAM